MSQATRQSQLFSGLTFYVSRLVPQRKSFEKALVDNAGTLVNDVDAQYVLIYPTRPNSADRGHDYTWILHCIDQGKLLDECDYEITSQGHADRVVGSVSSRPKATRTPFTASDDQILYNWLTPLKIGNRVYKGNDVFKQLAVRYPHHTFQSWRDRYIRYVVPRRGMVVTEDVYANQDPLQATTPDQQPLDHGQLHRSPVNTRTLEPGAPGHEVVAETSNVQVDTNSESTERIAAFSVEQISHNGQPRVVYDRSSSHEQSEVQQSGVRRQSLLPRRYRKTELGSQGFSYDEANRLYRAIPDIHNTSSEQLKESWKAMSQVWDRHDADEWESYYTNYVLPEYKRRNAISTEEALDQHVNQLIECEVDEPLFKLEFQDVPDLRSPTEKQMDREKERIQKDTPIHLLNEGADDENEVSDSGGRQEFVIPLQSHSLLHSQLPVVKRNSVHANESRKRAAQHTSPSQDSLDTAADVLCTLSPKKRLFGRVLELSTDPQPPDASHADRTDSTNVPAVDNGSATQFSTSSNEKNQITSSSSSLPAAQKPPPSFQAPLQSPWSQESAFYETAPQAQDSTLRLNEATSESLKLTNEQAQVDSPAIHVDFFNEQSNPHEIPDSQDTLSDTGSELMVFDVTPQRVQMWDIEPEAKENDLAEQINDVDPEPHDLSMQQQATPTRPSLVLGEEDVDLHTSPYNVTIKNRMGVCPTQHEQDAHRLMNTDRVETQALFRQSMPVEEASPFDLPEPDGGWATLGLGDISDKPDSVIETVELSDRHHLKLRRSPSPTITRDISVTETLGGNGRLLNWMAGQQEGYTDLPDLIFKRLASVAAQAVNMRSATSATLLLQRLVDTYKASEIQRQAEYKRNNPNTHKRPKPRSCLSNTQARAMLPENVPGVWTAADDDSLMSRTQTSIMRNEVKHSREEVMRRKEFLRARYQLYDTNERRPSMTRSSVSTASAVAVGKRKR